MGNSRDDPSRPDGSADLSGARAALTRRLGPNLLLATAGTLAALLFLEVAFRARAVIQRRPGPAAEDTWVEYHPVRGWQQIPGKVVPNAYPNGPVVIDREGFRIDAADTATAREGRVGRTLYAVGDSFTFGHGVAERDAWPAQLRRLHRGRDAGVVNLGACAYGIDQMLLWLREIDARIAPGDLVIVALIAPDLERSMTTRWVTGHGRPHFRMEGTELLLTNVPVPVRVPPGALDWGILFSVRESFLEEFVRGRVEGLQRSRAERSVRLAARLVEAMRDIAAERGAGFLLALLPVTSKWDVDPYGTMGRLERAVDAKGIPVFDCRAGFPSDDPDLFFADNGHPTAAGHEAIAERIFGELRTMFPDFGVDAAGAGSIMPSADEAESSAGAGR